MFKKITKCIVENILLIIMFSVSVPMLFAAYTLLYPKSTPVYTYKKDIITIEKHTYIVLYTEKSSHLIHSESCECLQKDLRFYEDYVKRINEAWRQVR